MKLIINEKQSPKIKVKLPFINKYADKYLSNFSVGSVFCCLTFWQDSAFSRFLSTVYRLLPYAQPWKIPYPSQ